MIINFVSDHRDHDDHHRGHDDNRDHGDHQDHDDHRDHDDYDDDVIVRVSGMFVGGELGGEILEKVSLFLFVFFSGNNDNDVIN